MKNEKNLIFFILNENIRIEPRVSVCLSVCMYVGETGDTWVTFFVFMLPFHFKITETVINGFRLNSIPSFVIKQKRKNLKVRFY